MTGRVKHLVQHSEVQNEGSFVCSFGVSSHAFFDILWF